MGGCGQDRWAGTYYVSCELASTLSGQWLRRYSVPLDQIEERQEKMQREVVDARHGVNFVMVSLCTKFESSKGYSLYCECVRILLGACSLVQNELQHVQVQLGVAGSKSLFYSLRHLV